MDYVTLLVQYFLNLEFQDFTSKLVYALQIAEVDSVEFDETDKKRLYWIEDNTTETLKVSLYALDMFVNPTKGIVNPKQPKIELKDTEENIIKIPSTIAQRELCKAVREVSQIVVKNTQHFNFEFGMKPQKDNKNDIKNIFRFDKNVT